MSRCTHESHKLGLGGFNSHSRNYKLSFRIMAVHLTLTQGVLVRIQQGQQRNKYPTGNVEAPE